MTGYRKALGILLFLLPLSVCAQTQIGGGGGSTIGTGAAVGPVINAKVPSTACSGCTAVGDARFFRNGVTAASGGVVTSASNPFLASDVNKKLYCMLNNTAPATPAMPISTIITFTSAGSVTTNGTSAGLGAQSGLLCAVYTQDDASAINACYTAAASTQTTNSPQNGPTLGTPGICYVPQGGYVVGSRIVTCQGAGSSICPDFLGAGPTHTIFYLSPSLTDPADGFAVLVGMNSAIGTKMGEFGVEGMNTLYAFNHPLVQMTSMTKQWSSIEISVVDYSSSNGNGIPIDFLNSGSGYVTNDYVQNSTSSDQTFACGFQGTSGIVVENIFCSNHFKNLNLTSAGGRTTNGSPDIFIGGTVDECNASGVVACTVLVGGAANFDGTNFFIGNSSGSAISVDATSQLWLANVNCGQFGSTTNTTHCLNIASGGQVWATQSHLRGNGAATSAVLGVAGSIFNDVGGNVIQNCSSAVCTNVSVANFATLGFSGFQPHASLTHTPNTCVDTLGTVVSTVLCNSLLDQNYQILNITASSNATTTCATAPIVTISDGTSTATLTLTTAKSSWSSAVDTSAGINSVFASGNTMTITYDLSGAAACAVPPTNLAVSYVLQSVLNP